MMLKSQNLNFFLVELHFDHGTGEAFFTNNDGFGMWGIDCICSTDLSADLKQTDCKFQW